MAEEQSGQEKTEQPTAHRLAEGRKRGDVAKSMEVPSAVVLLMALLSIYLMGSYMLGNLLLILRHYLPNMHIIEINPGNMPTLTKEAMMFSAMVVGPIMAVVLIAALIGNYAQVGFLFTTEKIAPKFEKIDPIQGTKKNLLNANLRKLHKINSKTPHSGHCVIP